MAHYLTSKWLNYHCPSHYVPEQQLARVASFHRGAKTEGQITPPHDMQIYEMLLIWSLWHRSVATSTSLRACSDNEISPSIPTSKQSGIAIQRGFALQMIVQYLTLAERSTESSTVYDPQPSSF